MDTANQDRELPTDDEDDSNLEIPRSIMRHSLAGIADAVAVAMRSADLHFPLAIGVPSSGALITMMTPNDPNDEEWSGATAIVCRVVAEKLDGMRLRIRSLPCEMVNLTMTAAEIVSNALVFDTRL